MLKIEWKNVDSSADSRPAEVDTTSSPSNVYVRKNIVKQTLEDETTGDTYTMWNYDEAKLTTSEYVEYQAELNDAGIQSLKEDLETLMVAYADLYEMLLSE